MARKFRTGIIIEGDSRDGVKAIRATKGELKQLDRQSERTTRSTNRLSQSYRRLGSAASAAIAGIGATAAITSSVRTLANFEQAMSTVKAVSGATGQQFEQLKAKAQDLGSSTRYTATQAAEGMLYLSRAGFDTQESLDSIQATLTLAQAGALDLGSAADIASNIMQGFGASADEAGTYVDALAYAANNSNTNVEQLGHAMSYVAPVANGLGVEMQTTAAAIGALSDAGLQSTMAGTGLRRVMAGLQSPTKKAEQILSSYGVTTEEVDVQQRGLVAVLQRLKRAGISTGDALEIMGDRGGPAFEVLVNNIPKIQGLNTELNNSAGYAQKVAKEMDDNLNGALLRVQSAAQSVVLELGDLGGSSALTQGFQSLASSLRTVSDNVDILAKGVGVLALAFGTRLVSSITTGAVAALSGYIRTAGVAATATRGLAGAMALVGGPVGAAVVAAGAIYSFREELGLTEDAQFNEFIDDIAEGFERSGEQIKAATQYLAQFGETANKYLGPIAETLNYIAGGGAGNDVRSALGLARINDASSLDRNQSRKRTSSLGILNDVSPKASESTTPLISRDREKSQSVTSPSATRDSERFKTSVQGATTAVETQNDAIRRRNELFKESARIGQNIQQQLNDRVQGTLDDLRTPQQKAGQRYNSQIDNLQSARDGGLINQQQYIQKAGLAWDQYQERAKSALTETSSFAGRAAENIQDTLGNTLQQSLQGNFDGILSSWVGTVQQMASQAAAANLGKALLGNFGESGKMGGLLGSIGGSLAGGIGSMFGGGTSTASVLGDAGIGTKGITSDIFGGFLAKGGPVQAGKNYVVGDGGEPEMFTPGANGYVTPFSRMGGGQNSGSSKPNINMNVTYNEAPGKSQQDRDQDRVDFMQDLDDTVKTALMRMNQNGDLDAPLSGFAERQGQI